MRVIATVERDYVCGRLPAEVWELTAEQWHDWTKRNEALDAPLKLATP